MRLQRYLALLFFLQISLFAQTRLEREINKIKDIPGITLEYLEGDRLSVNYDGMKTRVFYIGDKEPPNTTTKDVPSFVFDISELDTSQFSHLFYLWQEVPISSSTFNPTIGDIDNDGRAEIYGTTKDYFTETSAVWCFEQDEYGMFQPVYKYDESTKGGLGIYDIDENGGKELHLLAVHFDSTWGGFVHDQTFFRSPSLNTLATEFYFDYNIYRGDGFYIQLNDFTVGDFNNDNINEAIFFNFAPQQIWMTKFNEEELTFDSLFSYPTWQYPGGNHEFVAGFIIDDFDMDSRTDILYSSEYGNIYLLEHNEGDVYTVSWNGNSGIWNSFINYKTNDIDKNGKPEFWIGGEDFELGVTMVTGFETTGNNTYDPIAKILLPNLLSLNGIRGTAFDVDNDKTEEIFIRVGNRFMLIKFIGSLNIHNYEVYYFYKASNIVQEANMFQLPEDDRPSIVMSMYESNNGTRRDFSHILRHELTTNIKNEKLKVIDDFHLINNYPNPFNPKTNIFFSVPKRSEVKIIVYNSLGEEIITLIRKTLERGEHKIIWNGNDKYNKTVPSGIYLISMETENFRKTIKSVLLK